MLTRPGDLIATESPSYYGLLQLADVLGLKVIEIPSDPRTGISLEALQLAANQWSIKALVLTARLSNPFGGTIPEDRQKQLLKLTAEHNIGVVEDDIYGELMFDQGQARSLKSHDRDGRVIYCSKFLQDHLARRTHRLDHRRALPGGDPSLADLHHPFGLHRDPDGRRRLPGERRLRPPPALHPPGVPEEHDRLPVGGAAVLEGTQMTRPKGGFILWVSLPAKVNTKELHVRALEQGISIAPG